MKGDLSSFYKYCYPGLLRYAMRILGADLSWLAEDVVQDTILMAYESRDMLESVSKWRAWILTGIRNKSIKLLSKSNSRQNYLSSIRPDETQKAIEADLIEQETRDAFFAAINELPERYREIVDLCFVQGLKNKEVADRLDITEVAVRKRKAKLLEMLRAKLGGADICVVVAMLAECRALVELCR